jgi:Family of unknown function (DUF6519)
MKADFSRNTFAPWRHYRRVLGQQGRVVVDADRNEQTSIDIAIEEQTNYDVIGPSGVPDTSLSYGYDGGFQIGIAPGGADLTISHGRIYVDGLLVENDADTTLTTQPFLPLSAGALGPAGVTQNGVYGVYLDAWERLITPVDDPSILETALGGPDTSLRSQIAWQVKLGWIDSSEFGENPSCASILPPWGEFTQGELAAQGGAPSTDPLPCVLPPQTGFRSLENQLYRVEIHSAGGYGTATFKWSRENGSVIAGIVSQLSGSFSSPTFSVQSVGRDQTLGFATGDWVELIDDTSEFQSGAGELLQVGTVDPVAMTISLQTAPTLTIDPTKHPKLRRWDQTQNATSTGITIVDGSWIDLENGVQVQFSNAHFNVGDYWMIPARAATSSQTIGAIEWPVNPTTNAPLFEPPRGIKHHYTKLAIVAYSGGTFSAPSGASAVTDCRLFFPPLTSITSQSGPCTIVLQPGANWTATLQTFFAANPSADAEICFAVGQFPTSAPVAITTTGNVKVSGAGWGTQLVGSGIEAVLQFSGCASAIVRDLFVSAPTVNGPPDATAKASKFIHGALDFTDCGEVLVENVSASCGGAILPGAACVAVRSDVTAANAATGAGTARVRGSHLAVGEMQYGILLVHQQRAFVEDNEITVNASSAMSWADKIQTPLFQDELVHVLVSGVSVPSASSSSSSSASSSTVRRTAAQKAAAAAAQAPAQVAASISAAPIARSLAGVTVGATTIKFASPPAIANVWQTYLDLHGPKEFATPGDLQVAVTQAAKTLITNAAARAEFPSFSNFFNQLERSDTPVGVRGIAVGGQAIAELRIRNNSIDHMMQGVTAGVSHREKRPPSLPANSMQSVMISGNVIAAVLNAIRGYSLARWAIFVGNAANIAIEDNDVSLTAPSFATIASDGIRIWGYLGKKAIVRHNHVRGFTRDIFVRALLPTGPVAGKPYWYESPPAIGTVNTNLWLVADNVAESNNIVAPACILTDNWP